MRPPDLSGGTTSDALTSHLDLVPTIVGCTGADRETNSDLPGRNIVAALPSGGSQNVNAIRDAALYSFNMFTLLDAAFIPVLATKQAGQDPETPPKPDFSKRGAIRSVFDGSYRFTRYFAPTEHH